MSAARNARAMGLRTALSIVGDTGQPSRFGDTHHYVAYCGLLRRPTIDQMHANTHELVFDTGCDNFSGPGMLYKILSKTFIR